MCLRVRVRERTCVSNGTCTYLYLYVYVWRSSGFAAAERSNHTVHHPLSSLHIAD